MEFLFAFILIATYGLLLDEIPQSFKLGSIFYPIYIGIFEMSLTFYIWMEALKKANNKSFIISLGYLIPILSLFFIRIILKEQLYLTSYIGLALILGGVFIQSRMRNKD